MSRNSYRYLLPAALAAVVGLTACGGDDAGSGGSKLSGTIKVDGSSTVAPLSEAAAELFRAKNSGVQVTVGTSGTGGGFEKFCAGEIDISDASRAIKDKEKAACEAKGIKFTEDQVANDALTVVVSKDNNWVDCLTVDQLKKVWDEGSKVKSWKDIDPSYPDEALKLFGAGTDSGTFDYFTKEINGEEGKSRSDYTATEDDNVTVTGVSGSKGGLGYFGLSYFENNKSKLKAVKIDGGDGCVEPSVKTAQDGTYKPLSRPLFIYPSGAALKRPEVEAYLNFYVDNSESIAKQALFVPMTADQKKKSADVIAELKKTAGS